MNVLILVFFHLLTRFVFLTRYPLFNDEAIYLRYGRIMTSMTLPFYSMAASGKQPLVYWLYGISQHVISDPLIAGRVVTILASSVTVVFLYYAGRILGGNRGGWFAALLYTFAPIAIFLDRLALVDSVLGMLYAGICLFTLKYVTKPTRLALVPIGILVGISLWIKMTGLLFLVAVMVIVWYCNRAKSMRETLCGFGILVGCAGSLLLPLVLREEFGKILAMQKDYSMTLAEIVRLPVFVWVNNVVSVLLVYLGYLSPLVLIAAILTVIRSKKSNTILVVLLLWIVPLAALTVLARGLHTRYVLFTIIPAILVAASVFARRIRLGFVCLGTMGLLSMKLVVDPVGFFHLFPQFWVYAGETAQYIDGWSSGYGVREALAFVDTHRNGRPALIGVRWDSGNPEDAVLLYGPALPGISVRFLDSRVNDVTTVLAQFHGRKQYFITRKGQQGEPGARLKLLAQFLKPYGGEAVEVYAINNP